MAARAVLVVLAGLAAGAAAALAVFPEARRSLLPPPAPTVTGKALVGGPFSLVDDAGRRVTDRDFRGRYMLVFFGFTSCPDICPAGLQLMAAALDSLGPKADRITPIFISVDPERDTPQELHKYVQHFHPRLIGLTGTPEEVAAAAKAYRVYYKKVPGEGAAGGYGMDHSSIIYVMDPDGAYVTHFTAVTTVDEMAARLAKIL